MPQFKPNEPIPTSDPSIEVEVSANNPLPVGVHRFQLVVEDDAGNSSEPALVEVVVRDTQRPTAVIDAPRQVEFGQSFKLSGERSSDVAPGKVVRYIWTLVPVAERPPIDRPIPIDRPTPINPTRPTF